jgi:hypothetical protein
LARVYLTFWFDCEDYVSPYEPVSLQRLSGIFARLGLRATWKLVGEEARMLRRAVAGDGIRDPASARAAVAAIGAQDLGFHTDWHSVHPTVAEYLTGTGWEDGASRFAEREGPGMEALHALFPGQPVLCYGQPGSSWAPQVYPALRRWGVPLYMDEAGHLGLHEQPFYYCGVLNVLRLRHLCVRRRGHRPPEEGAEQALAEVDRIVRELTQRGGGLGQCWWHPNEWYTDQWWDGLNFGGGVNRVVPRPDGSTPYRVPEPVPEEERERRYASTEAFLTGVARRSDVTVVSARDVIALYPDRARGRAFASAELLRVAEALADALDYQVHGELALSAAEATYLLARALASPQPAEAVVLDRSPDGPAVRSHPCRPASLSLDAVRTAAAELVRHVEATGRLPDAVPVPGGALDPPALADACAKAYLRLARGAEGPVPVAAPELRPEAHVASGGVWGWLFPPGFDPQDLLELARLGTWTLKPAILQGS